MEGRGAEEAEERYYISQMTEAERLAGCLREVEKLAEKWLLTADRRKAIRDALEDHG